MLTKEQQKSLQLFSEGNNVLVTGSGGTGKTHIIRKLRNDFPNSNVQICAMTGCAAVLLECNACTLHSWAGIGLANTKKDEIVASIMKSRCKVQKWRDVDILIIDEVSMMSKKVFELLNAIGKSARNNSDFFGGIQVFFSGDFYQLPPIGGDNVDDSQYCFESNFFFDVFHKHHIIQLTTSFRQNDGAFFELLNEIRVGKITKHSCKYLRQCASENTETTPMCLLPTRKQVDEYNQKALSKLDTLTFTHQKQLKVPDVAQCGNRNLCKQEIEQEIKQIERQFSGADMLELKLGCKVLIIVNLSNAIVNGTQGILTKYSTHGHPVVQIGEGNEIEILPHKWQSSKCPKIYLEQYPLILAYALSIHRSQGMGLSEASIDIGANIFANGQTYVGLSRLRTLTGLQLLNFEPSKILVNQKVRSFYDKIA